MLKRIIFYFTIGICIALPSYRAHPTDDDSNDVLSSLLSRLKIIDQKLDNLPGNSLIVNNIETQSNCLNHENGIHTIHVPFVGSEYFTVFCKDVQNNSIDSKNGNWTVIQRRTDDHMNFYRSWSEYKIGFGNLKGSHFIGLENLYTMTTYEPHELLIIMEDFDGQQKYAKYDSFVIGDESEQYKLKVLGSYSGDAGDELTAHAGQKFTTFDRDNDESSANCALTYRGAWWYKNCSFCNLNGMYLSGIVVSKDDGKGIEWHGFRGHNYSLKFVEMLIRPKTQ